MKFYQATEKFKAYLQSVRNASPHTIANYANDLEQFSTYLTPPGSEAPALEDAATHQVIREFMAKLHDDGLAKSSIARKLAALRSFFKYCVREGLLTQNPARLVASPKLPKRIPAVLSAEEMGGFLDSLSGTPAEGKGARKKHGKGGESEQPGLVKLEDFLLLARDRAILELLYGSGLRVSELTGLNMADLVQKDQMLTVLGKGNKERIVPYGAKAAEALRNYWPIRDKLLRERGPKTGPDAVFLNYREAASDAAKRGAHRQKICATGECELGSAPALDAACLCHASAGGWGGPAGDPGIAGHQSLSTTQKYTHASIRQLMEIYDKSHPHAG